MPTLQFPTTSETTTTTTTTLVITACVWLCVIGPCLGSPHTPARPHIIFMVADDLGWNDIGYHNPDILTPNLDMLAGTGITLNHSYVQPLCSPSRSAFMTGYYPFRTGLQHMVIGDTQSVCAPLDKTFLPQVLKDHGYATHMVGKWHLGFCRWECTPTYRGFDSFTGYYNSMEDYYKKTKGDGFDFRVNKVVDRSAASNYSAYQYGDRVTEVIHQHNTSKPLFLYFPIQSVHMPLEVPEPYYNLYPNIENKGRRIFSGMVTAMDDQVGRMVEALQQKRMYQDTIIFFTADNGGWIPYSGNNYPLRGGKMTLWEGGTRVPGFVHYPKLPTPGTHYDGLMHAVDWFPTIVQAAGASYHDSRSDGISQWTSITTQSPSRRKEFVYNLDFLGIPLEGRSAIRVGDYKLMEGFPGPYEGWYKPDQQWEGYLPRADYSDVPDIVANVSKPWITFKGLYNLRDDPYERHNLYQSKPEVVAKLKARMQYYVRKMVPANYPPRNPAADPKHFGGAWTPGWC